MSIFSRLLVMLLYPRDRYLWIYARQPLDALVREYLRFVLSREGQEIAAADALGYLPLPSGPN
jgi:phosphate transport system substrate-binding protein